MNPARPVYVLGHRNPDTDSICSAAVYAGFKRTCDGLEAVAARCGAMNEESQFVLDYFQVAPPRLVEDVYVRLEHIMDRNVRTIDPEQTILEAGRSFHRDNTRFFPVVRDSVLTGVITVTDLAKTYIQDMAGSSFARISCSVRNLLLCLEGSVLINSTGRQHVAGNVVVCAMSTDILGRYVGKDSIAIVGNRTQAQLAALEHGASVLIVTGSLPVERPVLETADKTGCILISTPYDTYTAARLVSLSVTIKDVMVRDTRYFYTDDTIREIKDEITAAPHRAYPVIGRDGRFEGVVSYSDLLNITSQQVILVDHNERSQAAVGIETAEILEIIDHHRIGDVQTLSPIYMRNEPLGSTGTVIAKIFRERGRTPSRQEAGLLLSSILSDTLILKSPTAAREDKELAPALAEICGEELYQWGLRLLEKRTKWHEIEPRAFLKKDLKKYLFGKKTIGVAQVELLNSDEVRDDLPAIIQGIQEAEEREGYDLFLLMVTDIIKGGTLMIFNPEQKNPVSSIFGSYRPEGTLFLEGVLSRKKQVIPLLSRYFSQD
ncbi:MAG TPA: putative manganese-dependent inorganic diphosphatase [Clostridia bacterium]|nr:putative manganese-dependent inorganic diphosphatase [Clostridia bacterium]